jgi:glycosyltransferase involved in cell wall biosynthesis
MTTAPQITVFTPTFNRSHTLHRVFESLVQQTFQDFEWLIIDDGSTDSTHDLVSNWQKNAVFPIRYFFQNNGGKHVAHNTALNHARGTFFIIADSDDRFVAEALAIFSDTWQTIPEHEQPHYAGVWSLSMDEKGEISGRKFPTSPWDGYWVDKIYRENVNGEQWHMQRLDILRQFPFPPLFAGEGFYLTESIVWKKINARYKYRCINTPTRIYYQTADGIMASKPKTKRQLWLSDMSSKVILEDQLNEDIQHFWLRPLWFCKWMIYYTKYAFGTGHRFSEVWQSFKNMSIRLLFLILLPIYPVIWSYSTIRRAINKQAKVFSLRD